MGKLSYNREFACFDGALCKEAVEGTVRQETDTKYTITGTLIYTSPQPTIVTEFMKHEITFNCTIFHVLKRLFAEMIFQECLQEKGNV